MLENNEQWNYGSVQWQTPDHPSRASIYVHMIVLVQFNWEEHNAETIFFSLFLFLQYAPRI